MGLIKHILGFAVLIVGVLPALNAQKSVNTSGGEASSSSGTVSYTIGQIDYIYLKDTSNKVNQGVQQPYEFYTLKIEKNSSVCIQTNVYPNPTTSFVNLRIDATTIDAFSFVLSDINGKLLISEKIVSNLTPLDLTQLSCGVYNLTVFNSNQAVQTIQIIKN